MLLGDWKLMAGILIELEAVIDSLNPVKQGIVTVPGKLSKDVAPGTLNNIWKQAQLQGEN